MFVTVWIAIEAVVGQESAPRLQSFTFGEHVTAGDRVSAHCSLLQGSKPIKFFWSKNGQPIVLGDNIQIQSLSDHVSMLTIDQVTLKHVGQYSCTAQNIFGSHKQTARLTVQGDYWSILLVNVIADSM